MRLNDAIWGGLLLLFGVVLLVHVQSFPSIPGQDYGAAFFPGLIATGLAICGLLLIIKGVAAYRRERAAAAWIAADPWTRSPRHLVAFAIVIAVNVAYIVLVDSIGFVPLAIAYLAVLFWVFGVPPKWIVPVAIVVTLVIHYAFYKLLRVPLPWGVLQRFAW
jgi:putative tricarboxylic transport membrane protein